MKNFELIAGKESCVKLVKINGTTALAKDAKPYGKLLGIVKGTEDETGKEVAKKEHVGSVAGDSGCRHYMRRLSWSTLPV